MASDSHPDSLQAPRWLHAWAVLSVCATLPLLLLGAEVTTKQVGMVDPQGFRAPWHLLTVPMQEVGLGFVIEHSHRLAGFIVGTCIIVLTAGCWFGQRRPVLRWLGVTALLAVIAQGLLGGFRVQLNALFGKDLALVHGCFAQLVVALLFSIALVTSRSWTQPLAASQSAKPQAATLYLSTLIYLQIVFGALVRHTESPAGPRLHLLGVSAVVALLVWVAAQIYQIRPERPELRRTVAILGILVFVQLGLGVEAWLARFDGSPWPQLRPARVHPELLRSFHYLVGALVFSTSVVLALQARRRAPVTEAVSEPVREWEGVA